MLKDRRLKKGLSQSQLAKRCEIPTQTLQRYEGNFANINRAKLETLLKLCIVLDCKLEDILTEATLKELLSTYNKKKARS